MPLLTVNDETDDLAEVGADAVAGVTEIEASISSGGAV